ncbi:hypothetical protein GCM10011513_05920 [Franconibacter daqui]|uniref:hypothetical protein n=1 Tax=Franconibacter daqui TaxID=2047724 RepID=UPI0019CE3235|nr:hypothetical protein [Franconibacter daqui]GGD11288.1 hypothetical protein GCM10011513_05920 [Franconibacter daqui]
MLTFLNKPGHVPIHDFGFNIMLLHGFINQTEASIRDSIAKYEAEGPDTFVVAEYPEDDIYITIDSYMGIDDHSVNLDDIFKRYYPSILRRSALLTIIGLLEHEVEKFCISYSKRHTTSISLNDLKGMGFERGHRFIKKVVGLRNSKTFPEITKIIKLRNSCAHNDARLVSNDNQEIQEIVRLLDQHPDVIERDGNQVLFKEGALVTFLKVFEDYIKEIETLINPPRQAAKLFP